MRIANLSIAFALGACSTVAVQSAAEPPAQAPADPVAAPGWLPPLSPPVVTGASAEHRIAPNGKGGVTILARGENAFVARLELAAGAAVPTHRDATEEYIHVLEGGGTISIDGASFALGAGDTVYMPADAEVHYENGDAPMVALQVFAGPAPAAKYESWTVR